MGAVKKTKREKKFLSSGGVKARLAKGTITKKGKIPGKRSVKAKKQEREQAAEHRARKEQRIQNVASELENQRQKDRQSKDFMGQQNLGELDMDSFFAQFADKMEEVKAADEAEDETAGKKDVDKEESGSGSEDRGEDEETEVPKSLNGAGKGSKDNNTSDSKVTKLSRGQKSKDGSSESDRSTSKSDHSSDGDSGEEPKSEKGRKKRGTKDNKISESKRPKGKAAKANGGSSESDASKSDDSSSSSEGDSSDDNKAPKNETKGLSSKKQSGTARQSKNSEIVGDGDDDRCSSSVGSDGGAVGKVVPKSKGGASRKKPDDHDSDSDSDESDVEAAQARMEAKMATMKESDPDFHQFLEENESTLLEFGDDEPDDNEEESEKQQPQAVLTETLIASLERRAFQFKSVKALKKLVNAFKSACFLSSPADGDNKLRYSPYKIESSEVFDELMLLCLEKCHIMFRYHLLGEEVSDKEKDKEEGDEDKKEEETGKATSTTPINPKKLEKAELWPKLQLTLKSFFRSADNLLSEAKERKLLVYILKALSHYLAFLSPFPIRAQGMLKTLTGLWAAPTDDSPNYQAVRLHAFFRIRQLALTQPFPFVEDCLKKTYLAYARRAKFASGSGIVSALPTLIFMGNCLVELYSIDYHSSYQHAFVYIRQLALLLRSAMHKKTSDAMQQVYCWQYVHCLKLWVAVLASAAQAADGAPLRSLIYPLTEVILGTAKLMHRSTRFLPLRFQCVRMLQQLAAASETYIPTSALLLDALDLREWALPTRKPQSVRGLQLHLMIRFGKDDPLRTREQQDSVSSELFALLQREIELYRYSPGFPEFTIRIVQRLRQFSKQHGGRSARLRALCRGCIDLCERYSQAAVRARSKLRESPKDVTRLEWLRPASEPSMQQRHESSIARERKAEEAAAAAATAEKDKRRAGKGKRKQDYQAEGAHQNKRKSDGRRQKNPIVEDEKPEKSWDDDDAADGDDHVQQGVDWSDDEGEDSD